MVRSSNVREADLVWFKFRITNTGDTVLDPEGFGGSMAEDIIAFTTPIRERINEIYNDDAYLQKVVKMGAEKARESASRTVLRSRFIKA